MRWDMLVLVLFWEAVLRLVWHIRNMRLNLDFYSHLQHMEQATGPFFSPILIENIE